MASLAGWVPGAITFLVFALTGLFLWKSGGMMARELSERNGILEGFLEMPDEADFAAHMKNYFNKRSFGFRTNIYYLYQYDEEMFYRNFRRQYYSTYKYLLVVLGVAAAAYMGLFGFISLYSLHGELSQPAVRLGHVVTSVVMDLLILLAPLAFLPVWKETRRRYKLVDRMDQRFRRHVQAQPQPGAVEMDQNGYNRYKYSLF